MRFLVDFIVHFLSANSRHGTHSPFVYSLAEKAIYRKHHLDMPSTFDPKFRETLVRIFHYLQVNSVHFVDRIDVDLKGDKHALLLSTDQITENEVLDFIHVFEVIVIQGIYIDKKAKKTWNTLAYADKVTVSIDLFHFGLLFYRKGQTKEHFKLRYPFWL